MREEESWKITDLLAVYALFFQISHTPFTMLNLRQYLLVN